MGLIYEELVLDNIVVAMAKAEGDDENLKASNQMERVGWMNNYKHCAEKLVINGIIYI